MESVWLPPLGRGYCYGQWNESLKGCAEVLERRGKKLKGFKSVKSANVLVNLVAEFLPLSAQSGENKSVYYVY